MIQGEPKNYGEQLSQEQKEQMSPFDSYLDEKLNELNNLELQGSKEEIAKQVEKIIWEKLKNIFVQFPDITSSKEGDVQSYVDNMKTSCFTMKSLLNFALKYEKDETRKGLYQAFFSKRMKEKEDDIHKYLETQKPRQFKMEDYTLEEVHNLEKLCLEWQKYNEKQKEKVKKSKMTRDVFSISDDPEKELREVEEKFKKLGVV
mgnify:CR=1 FL=1